MLNLQKRGLIAAASMANIPVGEGDNKKGSRPAFCNSRASLSEW
jgi:hypothetical protein